jgi:hypothetical protein
MEHILETTGYEQLKFKYQRKNNAKLDAGETEEPEAEEHNQTVPINPAKELDLLKKKVEELTTLDSAARAEAIETEELRRKVEELTNMKKAKDKEIEAMNATITAKDKTSDRTNRRLSLTRSAHEKKLVSLIKTGANWSEDCAHMAVSIATSLDDKAYSFDETTGTLTENGVKVFWRRVGKATGNEEEAKERLKLMKAFIEEQTILVLKKVAKRTGDQL